MKDGSPDRIIASFTESGGHARLTVNIEGSQVIFRGTGNVPISVAFLPEEAREFRQSVVNLKDSGSEDLPYPTTGPDQSVLILKVTQPPFLAKVVISSLYKAPQEMQTIRRVIGQARIRLPNGA